MHRTIMVTGATSGIGRATARAVAGMGATVIVAGRDPVLAEEVVQAIRATTGNPNVSWLLADLSAIGPTLALAGQVKGRYPRLDVLVNNVGGISMERAETVDGFEYTLALNYLVGHTLLTRALLDLLRASAPARIVNVVSVGHRLGRIHWDDLQLRRFYSPWVAYAQAKLADLMGTYELARRLAGSGVTANAVHPGLVSTRFGATNNPGLAANRLYRRLLAGFPVKPEQGAAMSVHLATSAEVEGITGCYFTRRRPARSAPASYRLADQQRLWGAAEELLLERCAALGVEPGI